MIIDKDPENNEQKAVEGNHVPERLIANHLEVRQGATKSIEANDLVMRQAAAFRASTSKLEASSSLLGWSQTQSLSMHNSKAGAVIASGDVSLDQNGSYALVTGGNAIMDQCGTVVMVSPNVTMKNSSTVFLFAKHVEGNVTTMFNSQDAVIFGAVAGLVGGLLVLLGKIFRRR